MDPVLRPKHDQFDKDVSLDWEVLEFCNNKGLFNCAKYVYQFIKEINRVAEDYQDMILDKENSNEKYKILSDKLKRQDNTSANCVNCGNLQQKLQNQNSKFKALAHLFGDLTSENVDKISSNASLEKAQDMLTQMGNEYNRAIPVITDENVQIGRKTKQQKSPLNENIVNTPIKKQCIRYTTPEKSEKPVNINLSPILKKGKSNKMFWVDSPNDKTPKNENGVTTGKENAFIKFESSPPDIFDLSKKFEDLKKSPLTSSNKSRKSLSLLQSKSSSVKKSNKDKNLKQVRLTFSKVKTKLSLDVSREEGFCGGIRNPVTDDTKKIENNIPPLVKKPSYEETFKIKEEVDVIEESPSCGITTNKKRTILSSKKNIKTENQINDDDTTFFQETEIFKNESTIKTKNIKKSISPTKPLEVIYKEEPIRKKADKDKVPGWSCKKCADFYNIAFKGNDELIQSKINACSKHRGKFNPERSKTPPGFWSVDMLPTQDTETLNRLNNQD